MCIYVEAFDGKTAQLHIVAFPSRNLISASPRMRAVNHRGNRRTWEKYKLHPDISCRERSSVCRLNLRILSIRIAVHGTNLSNSTICPECSLISTTSIS